VHMISYVSDSLLREGNASAELESLTKSAREKNQRCGITGVLFYDRDRFFQTIEGDKQQVLDLYRSIEADTRHQGIKKLIDQPIAQRSFNSWSLETFFVHTPEIVSSTTASFLDTLYFSDFSNFKADANKLVESIGCMARELDPFRLFSGTTSH